MPPGSAKPSRRAATFTPSPSRSPPRTTTSPDMDADPELKAAILGLSGARLCELLLNRHGALDGIDRARELGQHAVASRVGDPAAMVPNQPVHDLASGSEGAQRPGLVLAHQARVPGHVSCEDRCQTPFDPLFVWWLHRSSCRRQWCSGRGRGSSRTLPPGRRRAAMARERATSLLTPLSHHRRSPTGTFTHDAHVRTCIGAASCSRAFVLHSWPEQVRLRGRCS